MSSQNPQHHQFIQGQNLYKQQYQGAAAHDQHKLPNNHLIRKNVPTTSQNKRSHYNQFEEDDYDNNLSSEQQQQEFPPHQQKYRRPEAAIHLKKGAEGLANVKPKSSKAKSSRNVKPLPEQLQLRDVSEEESKEGVSQPRPPRRHQRQQPTTTSYQQENASIGQQQYQQQYKQEVIHKRVSSKGVVKDEFTQVLSSEEGDEQKSPDSCAEEIIHNKKQSKKNKQEINQFQKQTEDQQQLPKIGRVVNLKPQQQQEQQTMQDQHQQSTSEHTNIQMQKQQQQQVETTEEDQNYNSEDEGLDAEDYINKICKFAKDSQEEDNAEEGIIPMFRGGNHDIEEQSPSQQSSSNGEYFIDEGFEEGANLGGDSDSMEGDMNDNRHPVDFARSHMQRIEEDMFKMHERHVRLMREMDENYKLIEQETQEYYLEFLQKWKEVAKSKIVQYRRTIETLDQEKISITKAKDSEIQKLREQWSEEVKDIMGQKKAQLEQIEEVYHENKRLKEELSLKDRERTNLKKQLEEKENQNANLRQQLNILQQKMQDQENELQNEIDLQKKALNEKIDQLEEDLQSKSNLNQDQQKEIQQYQGKLEKLEAQLKSLQSSINSNNNLMAGQRVGGQGLVLSSNQLIRKDGKISLQGGILGRQSIRLQNVSEAGRNSNPVQTSINQSNGNVNLKNQEEQKQGGGLGGIGQPINIKMISFKNIKRGGTGIGGDNNLINNSMNNMNNQNLMRNSQPQQDINTSLISAPSQSNNYMTQPQKSPMMLENENKILKLQDEIDQVESELKKIKPGVKEWYVNLKEKADKEGKQLAVKENDPYYPTYQRYKQLEAQHKKFQIQKKELQDVLQSQQLNYQTQVSQNPVSSRGSKSMSPRQKILNKQINSSQSNANSTFSQNYNMAFTQLPYDEQIRILKSDLQTVSDEKDIISRELKSVEATKKTIEEVKTIINNFSMQDQSFREELNGLRQKMRQNIQLESQEIIDNIQSEKNLIQTKFKKLLSSYNQILEVTKNQQQIISQQKSKILNSSQPVTLISQNQSQSMISQQENISMSDNIGQSRMNIEEDSQNIINQSRVTDQSVLTSQLQQEQQLAQLEQQIQERLTKEIEQKYRAKLQEIDTKARQGMKQREDAIQKLKQEKEKAMQDKNELKHQIEIQQNFSHIELEKLKKGEELFKQQFGELKLQNETILSKYEQEMIMRKKLHNQIEDMKGKIRVFCRVRPLSEKEREDNFLSVVTIADQFTVKLKIKQESSLKGNGVGGLTEEQQQLGLQRNNTGGIGSSYHNKEFSYDAVFSPKATQEEVFEDTRSLIQSAINGFNVCIFAYGETGSGKTYTMQGTDEEPGIVPRSIQELFNLKAKMERNGGYKIKFQCYMVEIFLSKLIDSLLPAQTSKIQQQIPSLKIMNDPITNQVVIPGITKVNMESIHEAMRIYEKGIGGRKVSSTNMNSQSSRSHLIFSIIIEAYNNDTNQKQVGKISFVDLAGSERQNKSNPNQDKNRLMEGNAINQSLLSLGSVIQQLSQPDRDEKTYIPYRDNPLTHLMQDSIGGNSKTLMFVNLSPSEYSTEESKISLFYGSRIQQVTNKVQKNVESQDMVKMKEEIDTLRKQLNQYQNQTMKSVTTKANTQGPQVINKQIGRGNSSEQ